MERYIGYASQIVGCSISEQLAALEAAGSNTIYANAGCRGPESPLLEVLKPMNPGDILLIWELAALGLSVPNLIQFMGQLEKQGVRLRSLSEEWFDTAGPGGGLIRKLFSALLSFDEHDLRKPAVLRDLPANRPGSKTLGRPPILSEAQVSDALLRRQSGQSIAEIAEFFDVGRMTVSRALNRAVRQPVRNIREPGTSAIDQVSISVVDQAIEITSQE